MFEPTSWKNRLTFGSDPVPDVNSGPLFNFHFPHYCRMGDLGRLALFIQLLATFHKSRRINWRWQCTTFSKQSGWHPDMDPGKSGSLNSNPGSFLV